MGAFELASLLFLISTSCSNGLPRFANYIQDHMVLQRAPQTAVIWGFGGSAKLTTLHMNNKIYSTISRTERANDLGESIWSITLEPISDEGPYDIHVMQSLANNTVYTMTLHDVLFGDVWICSGQSNMQMAVIDIFNATEEINNAGKYPKIRIFTAALRASDTPIEELIDIVENWSVASPQSVGGPSFHYMSAVCWLYGRMIHEALGGRPIGLIATSWGGTFIEYWMPPSALHECGISLNAVAPLQLQDQHLDALSPNNTKLFNSMIYPFMRIVIYGVIWYQGESNILYNPDKYACTFAKLIQYWRQIWNERTNGLTDLQFPFGFVQISTWSNTSTTVGLFPVIRWHQTFDIGYVPNNVVPKVFMAVSLDLRDDPNGIHPRTKHDVGYRLSRSGLAIAYNQSVEFQGPIVSNVDYSTGSKNVNITYTGVKNIDLRNPNGFEVCCQSSKCINDTLWVPATISSKINLTITLTISSSCVGQQLFGLRYLWRETPCPFKQAALYSYDDPNLPSPPYIKYF
ncbi:unnamed protein product [Rotaria socialis]|uniref:Sialate O-acetylesterase domain-containing protein n=1 Tax=Rotaria socialis TaxID=392032 RepID=A0A818KH43_9BILA|nr:unnamed protein product [Rotaria socialis]CAF3304414.1 unnamed protein product [Rotaria socialis]CAF3554286.1 unnamed protein product [Rotaria socialis]CAF3681056.1 unnamed protein product [Rotaria socialis]CAF4405614.1 unnamed protein product [Rotaria socialis]